MICAAICVLFMLLSASRKAVILLPIFLTIYLLLRSNDPIKFIRNLFFVFIAFFAVWSAFRFIPYLYESVGYRIESMINGLLGEGDSDSSTTTRLSLIEFGMEYFWKRPWWGYGMDNFRSLTAVYRSWGTAYYAHNNYVELLVDCGVVGTVIYYSLYLKMLIMGLKQFKYKHPLKMAVVCLLIGFLVTEYGMVTYSSAVYQLLLLLFYLILKSPSNLLYSRTQVLKAEKGEVL